MTRRKTVNRTGIPRIKGIHYHAAWVSFACINCGKRSYIELGLELLSPEEALDTAEWLCEYCGFVHSRESDLPFVTWPDDARVASGIPARRFWQAFFRSATQEPESYWKQCNACGRILPMPDYSRHSKWGPLERQMECRACKAVINNITNPKRTSEQHHEASFRRRIADLLLEGEDESIDHQELFARFGGRCFKSGKELEISDRRSWTIDHILPSKYFYPLKKSNAALLSREANDKKRDSTTALC